MRKNDGPLRLNHYLSLSGAGSRRACEDLIRGGRVRVDGTTVTDPSFRITDQPVTLDGRSLKPEKKLYYIALHKPVAYLCSSSDPSGKPLAVDLLAPYVQARLYTVGRLDFLSSGLIFLTNDGDFAKRISHPSSEIEKEYILETKQPMEKDFLEACKRGITVGGVHYRIKRYELKTQRRVAVTIIEGKNRELRRLFAHGRLTVKKLHRVRIGNVRLGNLKAGQFRNLTQREIESLMKKRSTERR